MGCWNGTCGITNLHIYADEDVVVFPLTHEPENDLCYSSCFYVPFPLAFYGKYNDYGAAEECYGIGLDLMLEELKRKLVELEQGENEYHDVAVKRDAMDVDLFWTAIHKRRLQVPSFMDSTPTEVNMVMVKKSVVDQILKEYTFEGYVRAGSGYGRKTVTFANLMADADKVLDYYKKQYEELNSLPDDETDDTLSRLKAIHHKLGLLMMRHTCPEELDGNVAWSWITAPSASLGYSSLTYYVDHGLLEMCENGQFEEARQLLEAHFTVRMVNAFMSATRKHWTPMSGVGSQQADLEPYDLLVDIMESAIAEDRRQWLDELDDEDDE